MKTIIVMVLLMFSLSAYANSTHSVEGMINVESSLNVEHTADKMEQVLKEKGMTIFNRIEHTKGAKKVGIKLRDTVVIIFGNPKAGSPLMKCAQTVALDLPQKALIWQDKNAKVWVSYNSPQYLAQRHSIKGCDKNLSKIEKALAAIVNLSIK